MSEPSLISPATTPAANGGSAQVSPAMAPAPLPDLQALLPDDLKSNPMLAPFRDISSLAKSYVETKQLVGGNTMKKLSNMATEQDKADFLRKAFDVPSEFEKYDVKVPEGFSKDDPFVATMKKKAFDMGLPPDQFSALLDQYTDYQKNYIGTIQETLKKDQTQKWAEFKSRYGDALEQKLNVARAALKELGGRDLPNIEKEMVDRGWNNSPWLAEVLVRFGEYMFSEDQIKGMTKGGKLTLSPGEAQSKIDEIMGDMDHPYNIANHPNHNKAKDEVTHLFQLTVPQE